MRCGLRHDPKVIAIARFLTNSEKFTSECVTCAPHVTSRVTFHVVTRVTVCALLDVWGALNNSLGEDGKAPYMTLEDLDDISEIPDLGKAMQSVGWVIEMGAGGLMFPNFAENNSPSKSRSTSAKTGAERAREFRARKRLESSDSDTVTASRNVTTDKRRIEKSIKESESAGASATINDLEIAEQAKRIVAAYPRKEKSADALQIVHAHLADGEGFEQMLAGTHACAAVIRTLPSGPMNRYVPSAEKFFLAKRWADDPQSLSRQGAGKNGAKLTSEDDFLKQLGGRAANLD